MKKKQEARNKGRYWWFIFPILNIFTAEEVNRELSGKCVISDKEAMIWVDIYTHTIMQIRSGGQVERTKVTGYLSLFLFIIFYGLNRIGFHCIDLKGPYDIIKSIKRCSSIFPYTVVLLFYLLWVWASFTNSIFTKNDYVTNFWVININKMLLILAHFQM